MTRQAGRLFVTFATLLSFMAASYVITLEAPTTLASFNDIEHARADFEAVVNTADACVFWANSSTAKDAFKITGNSHTFDGCLQSGSDMVVGGGNNVFNRTLRYVTTFTTNTNNQTFRGGVVRVNASAYPYPFQLSSYAPGGRRAAEADARGEYYVHAGGVVLTASLLRKGLHFIDGSAVVTPGNYQANVTIVATGALRVTSNGSSLRAYVDGLLYYAGASGSNAWQADSTSCYYRGAVYAPLGQAHFATTDCTFEGQVIGDTVKVAGLRTHFIATPPRLLTANGAGLQVPLAVRAPKTTPWAATDDPLVTVPEQPDAAPLPDDVPRADDIFMLGVSTGDFDGGGERDFAVGFYGPTGAVVVMFTPESLPALP